LRSALKSQIANPKSQIDWVCPPLSLPALNHQLSSLNFLGGFLLPTDTNAHTVS
jgi:hypothetical protein